MASGFYPDYPPALSDERQKYLLACLKDRSISSGLAVRPSPSFVPDLEGDLATTAPVTLFPSLFSRSCFEEALAIQTSYNKLYSAIASDEAWLEQIIEELLGIDDFVAQLWKVRKSAADEGYAQDLALGLFRSDYMVHQPSPDVPPTIKQVEFNTIASSFGGLSSKTSLMHQ